MAQFKLIADVSKIGLLQSLARSRRRLMLSTLIAILVTYGLGWWSAGYILDHSASVILNVFLITGNMMLVLVTAFLSTVAIGDIFFTGPWRQHVFLDAVQRDDTEAPVNNHSGEFMVILLLMIVGHAVGLNLATGNFFAEYHAEGYFNVRMRSEAPADRAAMFRSLTDSMNYSLWERDGIKQLVVEGLADPSADVQEIAAWSAGHMGVERATDRLLKLARRSDADPAVRREAATAIGRLSAGATARNALESMLEATDKPVVKVGALRGLALIGSPLSVPAITPLFNADNEQVMIHAFWAIRKIGSSKARDAVRSSLEGKPSTLKKCAALDALKKVATDKDVLWARREFQRGGSELSCPARDWTERDDTKHRIVIGDSYREKLLKIVANQAAFEYEDWFQQIINDPSQPYRLREVANEVIRQIKKNR
jgi:hypothetical protein